jgi:tRNA-modifying protein YgfZ
MLKIPRRAILSLEGPDTLALLERTVTHTVADWSEGVLRYGALLTPQGKVIADYIAHRTARGVLIDVHEDAADDLMKRLKMFRLRSAVEIARAEDLAAVTDMGGNDDPRGPHLPRRAIVPATNVTGSLEPDTYHAQRIAAGVPEWGEDYGANDVFPTDINMDLMGGVDYRKGCFVGQEVASRMKRRGKIRKRTVCVRGAALTKGAPVLGEAEVGTVTSVDAAGGRGLALVRLDRLQKAMSGGAAFTCGGQPASFDLRPWAEAEMVALTSEAADE